MQTALNIVLIVLSVALTALILLQARGGGLGGIMGGGDSLGQYKTRRGLEKTLFQVTIGMAALFFVVIIINAFLLS
ncbi:MAG: preprotein translocase subunit SecG [Chloroflexi bacterium]|nr:preprotein translocase subunit SecG [Chloroflexota bacterium]